MVILAQILQIPHCRARWQLLLRACRAQCRARLFQKRLCNRYSLLSILPVLPSLFERDEHGRPFVASSTV